MATFNKAAFFAANKKNKENPNFKLPTPGLYHARLVDAWFKKFDNNQEGAAFVWQTYDEDDNAYEKPNQMAFFKKKDGTDNETSMAIFMGDLEKLGVDISDPDTFDIDKALESIIGSEARIQISHTESNGQPYASVKIKRVILAAASSTGNSPKETPTSFNPPFAQNNPSKTEPVKNPPSKSPPTDITTQPADDGSDLNIGDILEYSDRSGSFYAEVKGINEQSEEIFALRLDTQAAVVIKPFQCSPLSKEQQQELRKQYPAKPTTQETTTTSTNNQSSSEPTGEIEVEIESDEPQFEVGMNVNYQFKGEKLVGKIHKLNDPEGTVILIDAGTQKGRQVTIDKISHLI